MKTHSFPLLHVARLGFRDLWANRSLAVALMPIPLVVGFVLTLAVDHFKLYEQLFLVAALKVPDEFVKGLVIAMFIRFLAFREPVEHGVRNREVLPHITAAALIYASLNFVMSGILAAVSMFGQSQGSAPDNPDPVTAIITLIAAAFLLWMFRFQWLAPAAALELPLKSFTASLSRGFGIGIRIFLMWLLLMLPMLVGVALLTELALSVSGAENAAAINGPLLWALALVNVFLSIATAFWQWTASVHAIRFCMEGELKND